MRCFYCSHLLSVGECLDLALDHLRPRDRLSQTDVLQLTRVGELHLHPSDTRGRQS